MKLNTSLRIGWLISFLVFTTQYTKAQTVEQTICTADSLSFTNITYAIELYNRALFFSDNITTDEEIHIKLANLNNITKNHETSGWHYKQAAIINLSDSLLLESAWQYLYAKNYNESLKILKQIDTDLINNNDYFLLVGLCFEYQYNDSEAIANYSKLILTEKQANELEALNKKLLKASYKKPNLAFVLSLIVPGLGQTYAGNSRDGANSFILQSALLSGLIFTSIQYTWVEGSLFFAPWWLRYYIGGATNAKNQAINSNIKKREVLIKQRIAIFSK